MAAARDQLHLVAERVDHHVGARVAGSTNVDLEAGVPAPFGDRGRVVHDEDDAIVRDAALSQSICHDLTDPGARAGARTSPGPAATID